MIIALAMTTSTATAAEPDVKIGMYKTMFKDVPESVVVALAKPMKMLLEEAVGITGDSMLLDDADSLAKALTEKKICVGVFHGYEYAWLKAQHPNLEPLLIAVPFNGRLQASLVVNANLKIEKIADLGSESIVVARGTKPHCMVYLDDLRKNLPTGVAPVQKKNNMTTDEVLAEIAAGNMSAAIVDTGSLVGYAKVNPGNAKGLKLVCKSEYFPYGLMAVNKDGMTKEIREKVITGLTSAERTAKGKPLMMLWGLEGFALPPEDYNDTVTAMLKAYPATKTSTVQAIPVSRDKK